VPLREAKPVIAPYRGCANHQFTGGSDCILCFFISSIDEKILLLLCIIYNVVRQKIQK